MESMTDYDLITRYLKGDATSFDVLVRRYMQLVYKFVYRYVNSQEAAEDVTQEVFVKIWRSLKKIDKNKNFKSWVYAVAKNTALDYLKKKKTVPFSQFENARGANVLTDKLASSAKLPDALAEAGFRRDAVSEAISQLSEKYRLIFSLYYYEYLNFREIADCLKEPINTIKSRHRRGLAMLHDMVGNRVL